jgi:hypothetical protein
VDGSNQVVCTQEVESKHKSPMRVEGKASMGVAKDDVD